MITPVRLLAAVPLTGWLLLAAISWGVVGEGRVSRLRAELAELHAAQVAAEREAADARSEQQRLAATAAARYEATRAARERDHADTITRLRRALADPVQCEAGGAAGGVLVPADAVAGLRDAGADRPPAD